MNHLEQSGHDFTEEKQEAFNWDIDNKMPINNTRFNPLSKEDIYNKPRPNYPFVDSPVDSPVDKPGESTQLPLPTSESIAAVMNDITGMIPYLAPTYEDNEPKYIQATLSEPLFECRIGWVYDNKREVNKRTGLPLKKKPSYRLAQYEEPLYLGSYPSTFPRPYSDLEYELTKKINRNLVVFIPNELWDRYPNSESYYKPVTTISGESARLVMSAGVYETEATDWNAVLGPQAQLQSVNNDVLDTPRGHTHIDKPGFFRKIWNWINS